jgi:hypothetical protein
LPEMTHRTASCSCGQLQAHVTHWISTPEDIEHMA